MKNLIIAIVAFAHGFAGFLLMFKIFLLPNIPPEDEIPPGVVMLVAVLSGAPFCSFGELGIFEVYKDEP